MSIYRHSDGSDVPGAPKEEEFTRMYSALMKLPHPLPNWPFFKALSCFRMASIAQVGICLTCAKLLSSALEEQCCIVLQGVYARGLLGNASSAQAEMFNALVEPLATVGCSFIRYVTSLSS